MWKYAAALSCLAAFANAAEVPSIAVFMDFESEPSSASVAEMQQEVSAILKPSGLALDWRMLNDRRPDESFQDLVVVRFRGSCQMRNPSLDSELGPSVVGAALASTQISDGRILPFSDVECDRVRRYIAPGINSGDEQKRDSIYGKALGRVLAHELYHIFTGTSEHAQSGVARSFHTRKDLTAKQFVFTPRETETLHEVKWRALLAGEGERPNVAATGGEPSLHQ